MNSLNTKAIFVALISAVALAVLLATRAESQLGVGKNSVMLQPTTPGTSQSGHVNVSGTIISNAFRANGIQLGSSANPGDVLTADSNGNGTWQPPSSGPQASQRAYRWGTFTTYNEGIGWAMDNNASLFGGVNPSNWTDNNATANMLSTNANVLRTVLNRRSIFNSNANVFCETFVQHSSTNGRIVICLFRIRNTTSSSINWQPNVYATAYSAWSEMASCAVNGTLAYSIGGSGAAFPTLSIPPSQTSSVIFVAASSVATSFGGGFVRSCFLSFFNNSLDLPPGLEYVDDFETMP